MIRTMETRKKLGKLCVLDRATLFFVCLLRIVCMYLGLGVVTLSGASKIGYVHRSSFLTSLLYLITFVPPPQSHRLGRSCPDRPDRSRSCIRPLSDRLISHFSLFLFVFFFGWKAGGGQCLLALHPPRVLSFEFFFFEKKKKRRTRI